MTGTCGCNVILILGFASQGGMFGAFLAVMPGGFKAGF
jgi:hypothetical protein